MHQSPSDRLKWARQRHGKYSTGTDAAKAFGWTVSTYLGHENGSRNPTRQAAKRYARAYRVRWEWLLEGEGNPDEKITTAPLIGHIGAGTAVELYHNPTEWTQVELPPSGNPRTVALKVCGGSMRGIADDGWLIYFDDERRPPTKDLIGRLCVVELKGGSVLVRVLQPGRRRGRYDLESVMEPTLRDQQVVWAARVTWIKPR